MYGTPTVEVRKNGPLEQLLAKVHPAHKLAKRPSISYLSLYIRRITACHQKFQDMIRDSSFLVLLLVAGAACLETGVDISSSNGGEIEQLRRPNNRGDMHRRLGKKGSSSDEEETTVPTTSPMPTPAPSTSEPTLLTEQEKDSSSGKKSSSKSGKKSSSKSGKKSSKSGKKGSDEERATEPPTLAPTTEQPSLYPTATAYPTISEYPTISNPPSLMPTMDDFDTTLDLDSVGAQYQPAFENAAARWDTIIVGDVPDITVDQAERDDTMCDKLPDEIDDIYICAKIAPNDGPGMILGMAGPEYARFGDNVIPYIGFMEFDQDDVDTLIAGGSFDGVILHEMAHVYGFGTLWGQNGLLGADMCSYNLDTAASAEFQALTGCTTAVPLENDGGDGTACGHWEEDCFIHELMTGFNTGNLALSTVTIASLEDIGYVVDYSQADSYTAADMGGCVCNNLQQGNTKKSVAKLGGIIPSTTTSVEVDDKETEKEEEDTTANNKLGGKITLKRPTGVVKPQTEEVEEIESEEVVEESEEEEQEAASATTKKIGGFKLGGRPTGTRGAIPKTTGRVGKIGRVGGGRSRHHRQLSNDGLRIATDYGKKALRANKVKRDKMPYSDQHRYIGDLVVIVLYIENDEIYTVDVWNTDL